MLKIDQNLLKEHIRAVPDWPEPGVTFRDITPLFQNAAVLRAVMDTFVSRYFEQDIDLIAGIDARGFMLGVTIAYQLGVSFVPIRKKGKLPFKTFSQSYELEYGKDEVEIHQDACQPNSRVVIFDDLIATGGTMLASIELLRRLQAKIIEVAVVIDLPDLGGSQKIKAAGFDVFTLLDFAGE